MREGWTYKKLGEVCETSSGGTPSKSHLEYYESGTIPWLRSGEVAQGLIYDAELRITDLGLEKSSAKIFPVDTVVLAMYGATVGQVGLLKKEMATNQAICGILPNRSFNPMFLLYILKSKKSVFLRDAVGGAQPNISQSLIKNTTIPIPPLSEQQRIVSELDLLSSIIEKKKAQLKEYDQLAQSIFYDMFGDPVTNEKGWEVKEIELLGECISGGTPSRNNPKYFTGDINWFSAGELNKLFLDDSIEKITKEALESSSAKLCKPMSLFIGMYDTAAFKLGIATKASASNQACANVSLFNDNVVWLYYALFLMREEALKHRHGARQKNLNLGYIKGFKVPVPPLPLQQSFASKIEAIEHQKALVQQSITETESLFNSRMDYYFD